MSHPATLSQFPSRELPLTIFLSFSFEFPLYMQTDEYMHTHFWDTNGTYFVLLKQFPMLGCKAGLVLFNVRHIR